MFLETNKYSPLLSHFVQASDLIMFSEPETGILRITRHSKRTTQAPSYLKQLLCLTQESNKLCGLRIAFKELTGLSSTKIANLKKARL